MVKKPKTYTEDCDYVKGQMRDTIQSQNRNLTWKEICPELIDNSLEHSNDVCDVVIQWNDEPSGNSFTVTDNGKGSLFPKAFFQPGMSIAPEFRKGNSTFGMGLFNVECCLSDDEYRSEMTITTYAGDGMGRIANRIVQDGEKITFHEFMDVPRKRKTHGINATGTKVRLVGFRKPIPTRGELRGLQRSIGMTYSDVIDSGILKVKLIIPGETVDVLSEPGPAVFNLRKETIKRGNHEYKVEWGITQKMNRDNGMRLVYGPRFFTTTAEPFNYCGKEDINLGMFYAKLTIPLSDGKNVMDQVKRNASNDLLRDIYIEINKLWKDDLLASERLATATSNRDLTVAVSEAFSNLLQSSTDQESEPRTKGRKRKSHTRDNSRKGVTPKGTGSKRTAKEITDELLEDRVKQCSIKTVFGDFGVDFPVAQYDHGRFTVTINEGVDFIRTMSEKQDIDKLFLIGTAHIAASMAKDPRQADFGVQDLSFDELFKVLALRKL